MKGTFLTVSLGGQAPSQYVIYLNSELSLSAYTNKPVTKKELKIIIIIAIITRLRELSREGVDCDFKLSMKTN